MKNPDILKTKIDKATVVSFDIFDTLLFRKTNDPETIFDLVGKHFGIHGFRKLRIDKQNEASRLVYEQKKYPHADIDDIYRMLEKTTEYAVDWHYVKEYEIQMEKDALVANEEMLEIFHYAKSAGKRVIATSDMYLFAETLRNILKSRGFVGFDYIYCSADEHKAKFDKSLFAHVAEQESVPFNEILHIGDKARDDGEFPSSFGIDTFVYERECPLDKVKNAAASEIDNGLYKILYNEKKGFWYNLGIEAGGPLYTGLFLWLREKMNATNKKVFFLSRDGYNLYKICKDAGYTNVEYLYTSRRSLVLAGITEINETVMKDLPPYTRGQTVEDILNYLCIPIEQIKHLKEAGFESEKTVIKTQEDVENFQKLYVLDQEVFLKRCQYERENAIKYFKSTGFLDQDSIVFDCGWSGSSQHLLDRLKHAIGCSYSNYFYYFAIRNTRKSHIQLHNKWYDTYAFDCHKNFALQRNVSENIVMYELFFSAPHESVYYYGDNGVVFESGKGDPEKEQMLQGIRDYLKMSIPFAIKYPVEYLPEDALGHLQHIIENPTEQESVMIGNLQNVDGFVRQGGEQKYIAYVTEQQYAQNPHIEIYWLKGLLKRSDIQETLKQQIAASRGVIYPERKSDGYHLEDEQSVRNYQRWIRNHETQEGNIEKLNYLPKFSVIMPVYNTVTGQLKEAIDSVLCQTYENYELILVDDHSSWDNVVPVLQSYESNAHVNVIYRKVNGHISTATNDGINQATGEFIVFMDCDDLLAENALYEFACKLNENPELDFIYSDEDKITEDGKIRHLPFFKPEWSPDLYMCENYTNHLSVYRMAITKEIGGLRSAYNGAQDYDFTLRFMERSSNDRVGHIAKVLYHWRERRESIAYAMSSKNYATLATKYAKEEALKRRNIKGHCEYVGGLDQYRVVYELEQEPLVSIVIPSKDHPEILEQCIESIRRFTSYKNYEIIVVDNGSSAKNKLKIQTYLEKMNAKYVYDRCTFNFSKMCNQGAQVSGGEYLLFLNDDIEIMQEDWLERMVAHAQNEKIGAVGAKLYYPNSTIIQHAGLVNAKEGPGHSFLRQNDEVAYCFGLNWLECNCISVTGACLLLKKDIFEQVGKFDESFPVAYNDVDLCFRLHEAGYYNVVRNDVVAYHYESLSRGEDTLDEEKAIRLSTEREALYQKHPSLKWKDPYLNSNLHLYGPILDLKDNYDRMTMINKMLYVEAKYGSVDAVNNLADRIQIVGWSYLPEYTDNDELERYLIFEDMYHNYYMASIENVSRLDLSAVFGEHQDLKGCGFEAVIDKRKLRLDAMQYKIGVVTIDKKGKRHIWWNPFLTSGARNYQNTTLYSEHCKLSNEQIHGCNKKVEWNLEYVQQDEKQYNIAGWIFCGENEHYKYDKHLILKSEDGDMIMFEVFDQERIDVAVAFPEVHYLYNTGFICNIWKKNLVAGKVYDIVLRLKNQFDNADIQDVLLGGKIKN